MFPSNLMNRKTGSHSGVRSMIHKILDRLLMTAMILSMSSCLFMVAITVLDVFARHMIGRPVPGVTEFNEVLMVCVVFLGLGLSQKDKAQIRAELFISRMSPKWRKALDLFSLVMGWGFWTLLAVLAVSRGWGSFVMGEYREGLLKFPIWPARWALAIGMILMSIQLIRDIVTRIAENRVEA